MLVQISGFIFCFGWFLWWFFRNSSEPESIPCLGFGAFLKMLCSFLFMPLHKIYDKWYKENGRLIQLVKLNTSLRILGHRGLFIAEPILLKRILVQDFHLFANRLSVKKCGETFDDMIVFMDYNRWKQSRRSISSILTNAKLTKMQPEISDCIRVLLNNLNPLAKSHKEVNMHKMYDAFTMDLVAMVVFASRIDSYQNPNNNVVKMVRDFFVTFSPARVWLAFLFPGVKKFLDIKIVASHVTQFVETIINRVIEGTNPQSRINLVSQYLLSHKGEDLNHDELVGICLSFLAAGFHTSSTTLSCLSLLLAMNPSCQNKVYYEIQQAVNESETGELATDMLQNLPYLSACVSETMRLYPAVPYLNRTSMENIDLGRVKVAKDTALIIPVLSMHHDPEFFPNPEKFIPERFLPENQSKIKEFTYLPFGAGPRNCVGAKFALLVLKLTMTHVLLKYRFVVCSQSKAEMKLNSSVLNPKEVILKIEKRS